MSIKTDSKGIEEPKVPETCAVFQLYQLFAAAVDQEILANKYRAGGMGYGEAKQALFEAAWNYFANARERRAYFEQHPEEVQQILAEGAGKARQVAKVVLDRARSACGLGSRS
jgi:tryptophanyl-tRNA synthetase